MSHQSAPSHRLTESAPGTILGVMMALMWIASMSMADSNPCTILPFLWGFMAVILITICCTLRHYKIVRLPLTAWLSLAIGAYFLVRAMTGFSLTDNWTDTGLIIFAFMFYLVGIYTGQSADTRSYTIILSSAIVLNLISMYFMQDRNLSLHWLGRADVSLLGPNGRNVTLFAYKNFAALFLALSGSLLLWQHLWCKDKRPTKLLPLALALGAIVASFFCGSRVIWFVVPLLFAGGWVLWLVLSLYDEAPIGWGIIGGGMLILTGVLIAVYDFIFGHTLAQALVDIDSHLRYLIWDNVLRATHEAPLHGFGAGGALWEIVTRYKEWQLPNYAHNEYVQVWADYGLIGLVLMLLLLLLHTICGFRALADDNIPRGRRTKTAMALLTLAALAGCAISDYVWHSHALLAMGAYACGVLASPIPGSSGHIFSRHNWAPGHQPRNHRVHAEPACRRVILSALALALAALMGKLCCTFYRPWITQWKYDGMVAAGADTAQRRELLQEITPLYPHSRIADHYISLAPTTAPDWQNYEKMLRHILQANPRQLFTASILAQTLGKQQRYEEAEIVFRRYYPGDGPDNLPLSSWATFYTANMQKWGQAELARGNLGKALSLLNYADQIARRTGYLPGARYRSGIRTWTQDGTPEQRLFLKRCRNDLATLRAINPEQDHSWKYPFPGTDKPALYQRYQKKQK